MLSTLSVASSAAFFSVYGMGQIFSGAFIPVVIMGTSLEVGKLVAASYLYRYWKITPNLLKAYLSIAVLTLMLVTSIGIFGFLTASYQIDSIGLNQQKTNITVYENQKEFYQKRLDGINTQIEEIDPSYVTKRMELIRTFEAEKTDILNKLKELDDNLLELKTTVLVTQAKIGPIIYVAKVLERDPDDATFWFVLIIIGVFDPLAVSLTLATNIVLRNRRETKGITKSSTPKAVESASINASKAQIKPLKNVPMSHKENTEYKPIINPEQPYVPIDVPDNILETPYLKTEVKVNPVPTPEVQPHNLPPVDTDLPNFDDEIVKIKKLIRDSSNSEEISKLYEVIKTLSDEVKKSNIRSNLGNITRK